MEWKKILVISTGVLLFSGCFSHAPQPSVQETESIKVDRALDTLEQHLQKEGWSKGKILSASSKKEGEDSPKPPTAQSSQKEEENPSPISEGKKEEVKDAWIDKVDLEKLLNSSWLMLGIFLLLQWFEIWYYNRTGKSSKTIDSMEAGLNVRLGILQKILYRFWRRNYFKKHPERKDPDEQEEQKQDEEQKK